MRGWHDMLKTRPWAAACVIGMLALLVYLPSLGNGFTYDDRVVVVENRFITSLGNLPKLISPDYFRGAEEKSWRPVTTVSYFFDHALWGKKPLGYHLTNVLIHAAASALVVAALLAWGAPGVVALFAGLFFALHPAASAAVEAVSFRDDLLAALFFLGGLLAYRFYTRESSSSSSGLYLASLSYAAACLSKENAIVLPALAWAMDVAVEGRPLVPRERKRTLALGSLAAVGVAYLALRFGPMAGPLETYRSLPGGAMVALATALTVIFRSAKLLVFPVGLSPVRWVEPASSLADPQVAGGFALIALGVGLAWWLRRREPRAAAALAWMALAWIPVSGIVPLTHPLADRYLYLPLVGFAWLAAEGLRALGSGESKAARGVALGLSALLVVAWGGLTIKRHAEWRDELTLWSSAVANEPTSYRAHYNLGDALDKAGRLAEAEASYRRALELKPVFSLGHYSLGRLLYRTGRTEEAIDEFQGALADKPDYAEARNHLGLIYAERGDLGRARASYEDALKIEPENANALNNLGILAARQGRLDEAEASFRRAVAAAPYDPTGFTNLGALLAQSGRGREAEEAFRRALALDANFGPARDGLARLSRDRGNLDAERLEAIRLARAGRTDEAVALLRSVLEREPEAIAARHALATTLLRAGRTEEAREELITILRHEPHDLPALRRMAMLERRAGRPQEALTYLDTALESSPEDVALITERGLTLGQAARLGEAEESFRRAIALRPEFAPAHESLGRLLLAIGKYEESSEAFRKALEIDPSLQLARRGLAEARKRSGSP